MNKWFVYYSDDHPDNGGEGFESFDSEQEALAFIENRMLENGLESPIDCYTLVCGVHKKLKAVQQVTRIAIDDSKLPTMETGDRVLVKHQSTAGLADFVGQITDT